MENYDVKELARKARRALDEERECLGRMAQKVEGYDCLLDSYNQLITENEDLRSQLQEKEMQLNEMSKLSAGVVKKSSQDDVLKAIRTYLNISKRKTLSKREAAKTVLMDLFTSTKLDLPDDIKELLTHLDDEQPEAKVVNVQGNYNDIHDNGKVEGIA